MKLEDVDVYDPDSFVAGVPHEMFATLRREAPVFWHERSGGDPGFWCVTRHADVMHVNRDSSLFSSYERTALLVEPDEETLAMQRLMMLNMDPPQHSKLRKIVNRGFTPRRIRELQDVLAARARRIVAEIAERGECEFVTEVACELPLQAIADFLGVPQEDRRMLFDWSNELIGSDDPDFQTSRENTQDAAGQVYAYAEGLAQQRRVEPRDDIVTDLLHAEVDGEALSIDEFDLFFLLLAVAGNETTRNAISHGMLALIEHPDQRQRLLDDPSLIDRTVEEILRWASPVMQFRRTATRTVELHGTKIEAGDAVVMWHISANRDEDVFDEPFRFDVGREQNHHTMHVAFGGGGPHFCLGANLARAEIKVMFEALLPILGDVELAGEPRRLRSNFINGLKSLPIRWGAAA